MNRSVVIRGYRDLGSGLLVAYSDGWMQYNGEWRKVDVSDCLLIDTRAPMSWWVEWPYAPLLPRAVGDYPASQCFLIGREDGTVHVEAVKSAQHWLLWRPRNLPAEAEAWLMAKRARNEVYDVEKL